ITFNPTDYRVRCVTQTCRAFRHGIQHRLDVCRRAGDNAKNLARRRLLLQRLSELLEQPHVLDCNYCLLGEGLDELDLALCEWPQICSANSNHAKGDTL